MSMKIAKGFSKWEKRVLISGGIAVTIMTIIFITTDLDIIIMNLGYDPIGPERFPIGERQPWQFLLHYMDYIVYGVLAIVLIMLLLGAIKKRFRIFLLYGLFIFISVAVGPGLIVNWVFKGREWGDFYFGWGRPRPREMIPWGGERPFYHLWEPAFLFGETGESFPAGHPTAGLVIITVFYIFRHPGFLARLVTGDSEGMGSLKWNKAFKLFAIFKFTGLAGSTFLGIMFGIGRIVQGAHFASDVMYSFVFTWVPTALLYHFVFRLPVVESRVLANISPQDLKYPTGDHQEENLQDA